MEMSHELSESDEPKVPVKMVADRDMIRDQMYSTGDWQRGQIKLVPVSVQVKLLRHPDTYQNATTDEAAASSAKEVKRVVKEGEKEMAEQALQELRDRVASMDRDTAVEYVQVHFGQKMAGNISTENARIKLLQLIDQYGVA